MEWLVTRTWLVEAPTAADAVAEATGLHDTVRITHVVDDGDVRSAVVRTRHPEAYVLVDLRSGQQWTIVDGQWKVTRGKVTIR
jgi:hypothetical protein